MAGVYGGVSAQDRQAARRGQLQDAALELLGTQGRQQTSVRAVCRAAGLSSRFFYESFADLDALVVAVFDELAAGTLRAVVQAGQAAGADPRDQAWAAIGTWVDHVAADPRRARVLFVEAPGDPALGPRRRAFLEQVAAALAAQARELYRPPPEAAGLVDVTAAMLAGGLTELMVLWLDGALERSRDELVAEATAVFLATVEGVTRAAAPPPP